MGCFFGEEVFLFFYWMKNWGSSIDEDPGVFNWRRHLSILLKTNFEYPIEFENHISCKRKHWSFLQNIIMESPFEENNGVVKESWTWGMLQKIFGPYKEEESQILYRTQHPVFCLEEGLFLEKNRMASSIKEKKCVP